MFKRIGFIGLMVAALAYLGGAPLYAGGKPGAAGPPAEDGSKITITSPKDGDKVDGTFDLKYELVKGTQAGHAHVYLDKKYQKGFKGTFKDVSKGKHQITVTAANEDHDLLAATHTITIVVQ